MTAFGGRFTFDRMTSVAAMQELTQGFAESLSRQIEFGGF